jgi:glucokinase
MSDHVLVFDVGGSHIAASACGLTGLVLGDVHSTPISKTSGLTHFLELFSSLAQQSRPSSLIGVSVAMPNPFDYARGISYMRHKYEYLYGIDLKNKLSQEVGCPADKIHFLNDAAAFLMGELQQGAGRSVRKVVGITLGTGVGSAFASNGEIVTEGQGVPPGGEIWNLSYKDGIVEKYVSTLAIQENFKEKTGISNEVRDIANQNDTNSEARETFEQFGIELGKVLRATCADFAPERIILGGGISRSAPLFLPNAERELFGLGIKLCVSELGERAPLIGAAVSWLKKYGQGMLNQ